MDPQAAGILMMVILLTAMVVYMMYIRRDW